MELSLIIDDIFQAVQLGDTAKLKSMLDKYPNIINAKNNDGLTLLGYASHFGNNDIVQLLLSYGAEVNAMSHSKISYIPSNTALHAAIAGERNLEVISLLLAHKAQTNIFDSNGYTCLHTAAYHDDNIELIRLLIEYGADVNAKSEEGQTALSVAVNRGNNSVVQFLREQGGIQ